MHPLTAIFMAEQDYFKNFGYVMDVYLPRDKVNRSEHRGFGFVTFETEGAVMRISQHGQHQIKSVISAIRYLHTCLHTVLDSFVRPGRDS